MTSNTTTQLTRFLLISALMILSACSGDSSPGATEPAPNPQTTPPATNSTDDTTGPLGEDSVAAPEILPTPSPLPERAGPRRETTGDVPHQQLNAAPVPDVDAELRRRVSALPGVETRASTRSLPGALGLWLTEGVEMQGSDGSSPEEVLGGSREFAHIHPDGSLHVWLPVERAIEVDDTKWGELHPWVDRDGFWDGVAMVYTPESLDELEITLRIVVDAYNFITGESLDQDDIP